MPLLVSSAASTGSFGSVFSSFGYGHSKYGSVDQESALTITAYIPASENIFLLNTPLTLRRDVMDGVSIVECQFLSMISYAEGDQDALESFFNDFETQWRFIAQAADEQLTADARELKRLMLGMISGVSPIS